MSKATVALIKTRPEKVLEDTIRLFELADAPRHLSADTATILKDNISWHYPFPSANTTPWQLEGTILALRKHGCIMMSCTGPSGSGKSTKSGWKNHPGEGCLLLTINKRRAGRLVLVRPWFCGQSDSFNLRWWRSK